MKKKLALVFISLVCLDFSLHAESIGCIKGKIRFVEGKKEIIQNEDYCYESLPRKIYSSGKCKESFKCFAQMTKPIHLKKMDVAGQVGSPGFKICEKIGGVPQIMEFWDEEEWIKTSRCLFKDSSYVDIGTIASSVIYE